MVYKGEVCNFMLGMQQVQCIYVSLDLSWHCQNGKAIQRGGLQFLQFLCQRCQEVRRKCSGMRRDLEGERESRDGMTGYGGDGGREGAEMQDGGPTNT